MRALTLCLCLLMPAALAQDAGSQITRSAQPAKLLREGKSQSLRAGKLLADGDRLLTTGQGRAELRTPSGDLLTLGGDSELLFHRNLPSLGGAPPQTQVVLLRGSLRAAAADGDIRLNLGPLKLRVYGAELWAAVEARGETICLLAGAAEVIAETGIERLDQAGQCLLFSAQNRRLLLKPAPDDSLQLKLARTAFAEAPPAPARLETAALPMAEPAPAPPPASAPPPAALPAPAAEPPPVQDAARWTVVLASLTSADKASGEAQRWRQRGIEAEVREGSGRWRILAGGFDSRAAAQRFAQQSGIAGAWVLKE